MPVGSELYDMEKRWLTGRLIIKYLVASCTLKLCVLHFMFAIPTFRYDIE